MKKAQILFIAICIGFCLIPLAGMIVWPTTESSENRTLSEFPTVFGEDGKINQDFFNEFDTYFNEHFAFRNELVYADARIQTGVFGVSPVDSVIDGNDGWLYYRATLDDYLGTAQLTEREIYSIAHNLSLACQYMESRGVTAAVAFPANKNTLYGGNMPYYASYAVSSNEHIIDHLLPYLESMGVPYANLVDLFREQEEVLYLKRDSHWNNRGALLAYNEILDTLGKKHDDFADAPVSRKSDEYGDLNRMVYTFYGEKELNYYYDLPEYEITNDATSVEDMRYNTACADANGKLVMFRDSFGNALIPFMATQFGESRFTKEGVYALEKQIEEEKPNYIVFEKAERNISDFLNMPPVFMAMAIELPTISREAEALLSTDIAQLEYDINYWKITGEIDREALGDHTDILVQVGDQYYEAYHTGDATFAVYLKKESAPEFPLQIRVLVRDGAEAVSVGTVTLETV